MRNKLKKWKKLLCCLFLKLLHSVKDWKAFKNIKLSFNFNFKRHKYKKFLFYFFSIWLLFLVHLHNKRRSGDNLQHGHNDTINPVQPRCVQRIVNPDINVSQEGYYIHYVDELVEVVVSLPLYLGYGNWGFGGWRVIVDELEAIRNILKNACKFKL